jgi:phosphatidate cytidylyltransferase
LPAGYPCHRRWFIEPRPLSASTSDDVWPRLRSVRAIGRHKRAPRISPSKTVEGLIGGIASACAIGTYFAWLTPLKRSEAFGISLLVATMGFFGGLVLSAVKRDRGVKDWGILIPGHRGILDRIDSLLFAAPIYFHFIRYWWAA